MKNKKIIAVIPARGGSKRIPKKNIIEFKGLPLIAHTIKAAIESKCFDDIIISTDSKEIADIAVKYGAKNPGLRKTANDDFAPVSDATIDTLKQYEASGGKADIVVQLFAVCPLRDASDIQHALNYFENNNASFQISAYKFGWMNPWWAFEIKENKQPQRLFKDKLIRSQDLPELYAPTGAIWIAERNALLREGTFYGEGHIACEMDWKKAVDIDNNEDLEFASVLFDKLKDKQHNK